ncbi:MAG TPA: chromosome segregation protein SMC [Candidatus Poseidoniales archaeon]|nr:chromosome segregation protein SMC [Candidatus Poseidoniales archaeon]
MYLKALEVENFKSFKGEATIPLDRGFTAITGPNGSGKSNCGDAIQFVLGPRSAKVLRAQSAKDLIFNGGKNDRPARNAKVTLIFANPILSNGRRRLPIESDEVKLTRAVRLTRSDNLVTTYFLNGEESGQKAFHRLLGQANARPDGYNIVLQGDVTKLSQMTPKERRKVLDSVAGVTSYDDEIRKAERQKSQVEEYIDRISLVQEEQKSRLKTLEKEKALAEKAKSAKEEFDFANIELYQSRHFSAKAEIKHHSEERSRHLAEAVGLESEVKAAQVELLAFDDQIGELETKIRQAMGDDKGGLLEEIRRLQVAVDRNADRIGEAKDSQLDDEENLERLESQITAAKTDLANHEQSLSEAKTALAESKIAFAAAEAEEKEIQTSLESSDEASAGLSRALSKANETLELSREAVTKARQDADKVLNQAEMIAEQLSTAEEEVDDARLAHDDLVLQGEEMDELDPEKDRTHLATQMRSAQNAEARLIDEKAAVERRLHEAERKLVSARTELEKRSGSNGMAPGAAAIMAARDRGELRGIIGTIGELCAPRDSVHEDALATAVGGGMNSVVVENDQVAAEAMAMLKNRRAGRATFLPLNKLQTNRSSGKAAMVARKPGVVGFAHELLDYDPRIATAVAYALRNTLVVDNLATARRLMGGVRLVTLGGEVTEPGGAMVGGSKARMKTGFGGKIQGASEVETLGAEVDRLSLMEQTVAAALREAISQQQSVRALINSLAEDDFSVKVGSWNAEMELAKKALDKTRGAATQLETRLKNLEADHTGKLSMVESAQIKFIEAEAARDQANENLQNSSPEGIRTRLLAAQSLRVNAEGASTKASVMLDSGQEKSQLLSQRADSLTTRADEIQSAMAGRIISITSWTAAIEEDGAVLTSKEAERSVLLEEHVGLETEKTGLTERRADLRANATQKANNIIHSRSMAEDIARSISSRQGVLSDLLVEMADINIPVADPNAILPNVGQAEKKLRDLQRKLDRFGPVNMLAIEQYSACKERLDEMKSDFKTLQERRKRLIDITDKLETSRKTRLLATLKEVNKNFKKVYKRLSNGGRGELFLENPDEPFKAGLELWAQPKGKNAKVNRRQLSGGEQSMASLAMIFAIQDYDPSPFYYFDEVDQNLDVPNSRLIAKECRNRSESAQFIMVTLRKVSLELADHHIGITHGGDGCSRRILDFNRQRAIELGSLAEKEAKEASDKNHSRIEEARLMSEGMPEVPEPLNAPKSLGGLLNHIEQEDDSSTGFEALAERTEELTEDIEEHREIVNAISEQDQTEEVIEQEGVKEKV